VWSRSHKPPLVPARDYGRHETPTTALLERLAEHAIVIATKGKSYRMPEAARQR
jgi:hypothetical protein